MHTDILYAVFWGVPKTDSVHYHVIRVAIIAAFLVLKGNKNTHIKLPSLYIKNV